MFWRQPTRQNFICLVVILALNIKQKERVRITGRSASAVILPRLIVSFLSVNFASPALAWMPVQVRGQASRLNHHRFLFARISFPSRLLFGLLSQEHGTAVQTLIIILFHFPEFRSLHQLWPGQPSKCMDGCPGVSPNDLNTFQLKKSTTSKTQPNRANLAKNR